MLPYTSVVLALGLPPYQGSNVAVREVFDAAVVCSFFSDTSGCALKGDTFSREVIGSHSFSPTEPPDSSLQMTVPDQMSVFGRLTNPATLPPPLDNAPVLVTSHEYPSTIRKKMASRHEQRQQQPCVP